MSVARILNFIARVRRSLVRTTLFAALMAIAAKFIFGLPSDKSFFFVALPVMLLCEDPVLRPVGRALIVSVAGAFWGFVAMAVGKYVFGLSEEQNLLFVWLPIAVPLAVFLWVKLPPNFPQRARRTLDAETSSLE